ncbi:hypothetical protein HQN89_34760 [Paenibacillus frigoriresistens]|uniref:DUF5412 family protein n=1 Tax=Paenibacillus alginolyticus TaxID=59839 RepID=UPI001565AD52|nr:DUF5412 family protein [Paenibacillus frigoriresistens]NRF95970.1 hypothetical protein [Paenibacillus frigoriresistens]
MLRFLLSIGLLFIGLICYGIYWAFFDMNRLPTGELIEQSNSPSLVGHIFFVSNNITPSVNFT